MGYQVLYEETPFSSYRFQSGRGDTLLLEIYLLPHDLIEAR